ncbi:MAG: GH3 auxin-responsive promoter family protein, partial [Caldilineaceae bacterium]
MKIIRENPLNQRHPRSIASFSIACTLANGAWVGLSLGEAWRWRQAAGDVAAVQQETLFRILRANRTTQYAARTNFSSVRSIADFQKSVPLASYDDITPHIECIAAGEPGVLTAEPVRLLEPTSGSTAATKLIPYTDSLKAEFQRGIGPWVVRTFLSQPALFGGPAWWSVTPVTARHRRASGGIPIGFEEESEYFGRGQSRLIRSLMAVPGEVKLITDAESFRYVTLLFLLRSRSLRLISVWNPTFPMLVLDPLAEWWPQLADDIAAGTLTPPVPLEPDLHTHLAGLNRADPRRAKEVRA